MIESNDQPFVNSTAPDHEPDVDEVKSRNKAVAKLISTRTGLLDLPPEIRLMIFRHLLVRANPLPDFSQANNFWPDLSILKTSKLIHQEAFDVFYKENRFARGCWYPPFSPLRFPQIIDTMQNIETNLALGATLSGFKEPRTDVATLVRLMRLFGNRSVIRRNLVLLLYINPRPRPLKWLVRALGRFTNFRTITLHLCSPGFGGISHDNFFEWCKHLKTALKPVLGYAEEFEYLNQLFPASIGLRFQPVDHQKQSREPDDGDCDYLDGIRLGWNETLTNTDDASS